MKSATNLFELRLGHGHRVLPFAVIRREGDCRLAFFSRRVWSTEILICVLFPFPVVGTAWHQG